MSFLKSLIGEDLYKKQKEFFRETQKNLTRQGQKAMEKVAQDCYIVQKEVFKDAQKQLEDAIKKKYEENASMFFDKLVEAVAKKGFFGKILARVLASYKDDVLGAIGAK